MSLLMMEPRTAGILAPICKAEFEDWNGLAASVYPIAAHCQADRPGGRRTLLPAERFPELMAMLAEFNEYDPSRFEHTLDVARLLGAGDHVYLGVDAYSEWLQYSYFKIWIGAVHTKIGLADLRRLDAASDGAVRWVSPAGVLVPQSEQLVRSR
jgi:hypothetical protein